MTRKSSEAAARLSDDWQELVERGEAPGTAGRSAEEARRDQVRRRKITPSERRRRKHKITPTLSSELIAELERIGQEMGYVDDEGEGVVASAVVERFLRLAVEAYDQGMIEQYEEQVVVTRQAFRWRSAGDGG